MMSVGGWRGWVERVGGLRKDGRRGGEGGLRGRLGEGGIGKVVLIWWVVMVC